MKKLVLIISIILLAFVVRIWRINLIPPALGNDEISIAYDSYSIINTGRDSTGTLLPLSFKSNGNYKAPLYAYIAAPIIGVLGNNELAVRFPSVLFGTLTVLGIYYLVFRLTGNEKWAILSSFLLAITPWHVYTSRIALESNVALFFVVFGSVMFLKGVGKYGFLYLSSLFFALSVYAYQTEMIFAPVLLFVLSIFYSKKSDLKKLGVTWGLFLALLVPFFINTLFLGGENRAGNVFILNDYQLASQIQGVGNIAVRVYTVLVFCIDKFFQYTSLSYVFGHGLPISAPFGSSYFGLLNLLELPFFLIGAYSLLKHKNKTISGIIIAWFIIGPFISCITLGELNLIRNLVSVIPLTIITAYGIISIFSKKAKSFPLILVLLAIFINFVYFFRYYTKYFPIYHAENWSYGFKEIAEYVRENESSFKKIVISYEYGHDRKLYGVPSLFVLYYNKIDPAKYIAESKNDGYLTFGKYEYRTVDWPKEKIEPGTLYIVGALSVPLKWQKIHEIYSLNLPDGSKSFSFYEAY